MERQAYISLAQCLPERAATGPNRTAYIFLQADGAEQHISYRQLYADALIYADTLAQSQCSARRSCSPRFDHGYEVIAAFWGAIHRGAVPAVFPYFVSDPIPEIYQRQLPQWTDFADAKAILTLPELESLVRQWSTGALAAVTAKPSEKRIDLRESNYTSRAGEDVAYIQLTTGSTRASKGAMISHRGALSRMIAFSSAFDIHEGDTMVYWLTFNYSAGLQFPVLAPVVVGSTVVNLSPKLWTRHPETFLQAIHRFRGVGSVMPNSSLNHCIRNVRRHTLEGVDLSSWRVFGIAGEMLQHESLQSFTEQFAPYHFAAQALRPFYACAECGLITAPAGAERPNVDWTLAWNSILVSRLSQSLRNLRKRDLL